MSGGTTASRNADRGSTQSCRTDALECTPYGHATDPADAGFYVARQNPYCGGTVLGSGEIWIGFPGTFNALCLADGAAPPPDAGVNSCN